MSISVAVAGASGYAGGELLRLLAGHPTFQVKVVTAHHRVGQRLATVHPHLVTFADLELRATEAETLAEADVIFLALPHGTSGALAKQLPQKALVVDCGADHRLLERSDWENYYGGEYHAAWEYGVPELPLNQGATKQRAKLAGVNRIAAPGCNASAVTLALAPGIAAGVIEPYDLVSMLAVGTSGAGRVLKEQLLASEITGSASVYAVGGKHRHIPEIIQNLKASGGEGVTLSLTPALVPLSRGILATSTARLVPGVSATDVREAWVAAYAGEMFVRVLPEGVFPRVGDTIGANTALIGLALDQRAARVVVVSALDNLVKGTAGAAIQSANIALGLPEDAGISMNGVAP